MVKTNLKKYGFKTPAENKKVREKISKTKRENYIKKDNSEYINYKKNVLTLTKRIRSKVFENWNGYDYYDNEYIKDNLNLHYNDNRYPTIDHMISVYYGFTNSIPEEDICNINNLCITKRGINSSKKSSNYNDYKV